MGKSKKNKDFKKAKLKVGKKLKKANETKTDFKAAKLVILSQLKSSSTPGVSVNQFEIAEIASHIRHHNVNVRKEALSRLNDNIVRCSDTDLKKILGVSLEIVLSVCSDVEHSVRDGVARVMKSILSRVSSKDLEPSMPLLSAHLSCAATHLNADVRLSACRLLGMLVESSPTICTRRLDLLSCYADLAAYGKTSGKLVSRLHKTQVAAGLRGIVELNFKRRVEDSVLEKGSNGDNKNKLFNVSRCSLVLNKKMCDPFLFPISADEQSLVLDNIFGSEKALPMLHKCVTFCEDFWLELTGSDSDAFQSTERSFDETTLNDMSNILEILLAFRFGDPDSSNDEEWGKCRPLDNTSFQRDDERHLSRFARVLPCSIGKRSSGDSSNVVKLCRDVNLAICQILAYSAHREKFRSVVFQYLSSLNQKKKRINDDSSLSVISRIQKSFKFIECISIMNE